jgi:hypothetical protein
MKGILSSKGRKSRQFKIADCGFRIAEWKKTAHLSLEIPHSIAPLARLRFLLVGVQAGGIRIIRLGGIVFFYSPPTYPPQREAGDKITSKGRRSRTVRPCKFPPDRPDPMEE